MRNWNGKRRILNNGKYATYNNKPKKVADSFLGVCELRQLPKGEYFRIIDSNGKVGQTTYIKSDYDRSTKKYLGQKWSDIWGTGRSFKGTQKVTTDFDW